MCLSSTPSEPCTFPQVKPIFIVRFPNKKPPVRVDECFVSEVLSVQFSSQTVQVAVATISSGFSQFSWFQFSPMPLSQTRMIKWLLVNVTALLVVIIKLFKLICLGQHSLTDRLRLSGLMSLFWPSFRTAARSPMNVLQKSDGYFFGFRGIQVMGWFSTLMLGFQSITGPKQSDLALLTLAGTLIVHSSHYLERWY